MMLKQKQQGAVLIFSLIMLLLMSLLGVNAMQQNRLQFLMSSNAQLQTDTLVQAENILEMAEAFIPLQREETGDGVAAGTCKKDADGRFTPFVPQDITASLSLSDSVKAQTTARVLSCDCLATGSTCVDSFTACLAEIYTIQVKFQGEDNAERTVESKYAVQCVQ